MSLEYDWQKFYEVAVRETDFQKMQKHIARTEQAIQQRLSDNPPPITGGREWQAIGTTLAALTVLKAESRNGHHLKLEREQEVGGYSA
jgi:hypothetical protein